MNRRIGTLAVALVAPLFLGFGCGPDGPGETDSPTSATKRSAPVYPHGAFVDRALERGLEFRFLDDASDAKRIYETLGGGVALFDANGDGHLDIFLPGGGQDPGTQNATTFQALFLNDGKANFVNATEYSGLGHRQGAFAIGATAGDIDGDGDEDLYVTAIGPNRLYLNDGRGGFTEVPQAAGTEGDAWSSGALLFDADSDGDLDLYVVNYVVYDPRDELPCTFSAQRIYCTPDLFAAAPDRFYRNLGDGRFIDATEEAGIDDAFGKGLASIAADFDSDGDLDVYVANDISANLLWLNDGRGGFRDVALPRGAALGRDGLEEASMGVGLADFDGDQDLDLVVSNFSGEVFNFFRLDPGDIYTEVAQMKGLAMPTAALLGFGVVAADFDLDGRVDLALANGHINDLANRLLVSETFRQPNLLLRNNGTRFEPWPQREADLAIPNLGRGLATGDLDGDGDLDLVLSRIRGASALFLAEGAPPAADWIAVRPLLPSGSPAVGTRATLSFEEGPALLAELVAGGSYASQNEPVLRFGLGGRVPTTLTLRWLGGQVQELPAPPRGQVVEFHSP